jgi:acetylornithine/succinyldiaminopimelate/putrescine aminotransferase
MVIDEVQTGMGRTGTLFAYRRLGDAPDVITLAKGLAGGVPIGAMHAARSVADCFAPGMHAATFGGNPLATTIACAVLRYVHRASFLKRVAANGAYLKNGIIDLKKRFAAIGDVRGEGLMVGFDLSVSADRVKAACLNRGLIVNSIVGKKEIDTALRIIADILASAV